MNFGYIYCMSDKAEIIRIKYQYRELILKRKLKMPVKTASKLIGPDCAYHLYQGIGNSNKKK